jgi:hypothetical protein
MPGRTVGAEHPTGRAHPRLVDPVHVSGGVYGHPRSCVGAGTCVSAVPPRRARSHTTCGSRTRVRGRVRAPEAVCRRRYMSTDCPGSARTDRAARRRTPPRRPGSHTTCRSRTRVRRRVRAPEVVCRRRYMCTDCPGSARPDRAACRRTPPRRASFTHDLSRTRVRGRVRAPETVCRRPYMCFGRPRLGTLVGQRS